VVALVGVLGVPAAMAADAAAAPAPSIDVTGFVDTYYSYNFNKPAGRVNQLHVFDVQHNGIDLALAEVAFEKKPVTGSPVGFRVDLDFGLAADISNSFEPGNKEILKNVQQGYVSWLASPKVQIDVGKFVTPIGNELVESKDNWNYTRSIQFGYAIPIYHAGARVALIPSDKFTLTGFLVNGWNNVQDNNNDKTFALQFIAKPSAKLTWTGAAMFGKETTTDTRSLYDTVLTLSPSSTFSLAANYDHGKDGASTWDALSAYARIQAGSVVAFSPRFEWLNDDDAFMTATSQKLTSFTLTTEFKLGGGVLTRIDLRSDHSDVAMFESDSGFKKNQPTLTVGVVYAFGGKI